MSTLSQVLSVSAAIVASIGGGGLIVFGLSSWLGKVWANRLMQKDVAEHARELESLKSDLRRDTESYKIKLRKSELLFEKEFEAASAFVSLKQSLYPTSQHPGMEWEDACIEIAPNLDKIERDLSAYLSKYGAILPDTVRNAVSGSIGLAGEGKFEVGDPDMPHMPIEVVGRLFERLDDAERGMIAHVRSQTSV